MNILAPGLVIGLAIILQPELRRIFIQIGRQSIFGKNLWLAAPGLKLRYLLLFILPKKGAGLS